MMWYLCVMILNLLTLVQHQMTVNITNHNNMNINSLKLNTPAQPKPSPIKQVVVEQQQLQQEQLLLSVPLAQIKESDEVVNPLNLSGLISIEEAKRKLLIIEHHLNLQAGQPGKNPAIWKRNNNFHAIKSIINAGDVGVSLNEAIKMVMLFDENPDTTPRNERAYVI